MVVTGHIHILPMFSEPGYVYAFKCVIYIYKFVVSARFLIGIFFLISLERNDFYLTFRSKTSAIFYVFTVTISILLNMLTIISCFCGNIVD